MYIWYGLRNSGIVPFNVYREQVCCACHPLCAFYDNALLISAFQAARMVTVISSSSALVNRNNMDSHRH